MKKVSTLGIILPHLLMLILFYISYSIIYVFFCVNLKSLAYGLDSVKADPVTGRALPDPNVDLGVTLLLNYKYFNYILFLLFILYIFLRYILLNKRIIITFSKKAYVIISSIFAGIAALIFILT